MYIDTHLHTDYSSDCGTPMRAQIERAVELGMPSLTITDHQDFDFPPGDLTFQFDTDQYLAELTALREEYADRIRVLIGVELGLQPHLGPMLADYVSRYSFDYCIGSTHLVDGFDPYYPEFYEGRDELAAYRQYFEESYENLKACDSFHAAGHLDYIVRYGPNKNRDYTFGKFADILNATLELLVNRGKGLECNTAGLAKGLGVPNPSPEILTRYRELGGEIVTLGSDAHLPERMGYGFAEAGALLKSLGYKYYAVYEGGEPRFYPL